MPVTSTKNCLSVATNAAAEEGLASPLASTVPPVEFCIATHLATRGHRLRLRRRFQRVCHV